MKAFLIGLIFFAHILCAYANDKNVDYYAFCKYGTIDYSITTLRKNIVQCLIDSNTIFKNEYINSISYKKQMNIINYGKVDIIIVRLSKQAPVILNSVYLLIINHDKKELIKINLEKYFFIKTTKIQKNNSIIGLVSFRGNFQLINYDLSKNEFNRMTLFENTDNCVQYIHNSLSLKNIDINNDGWLDILVEFRVNIYCNDKGESDKILKNKTIIKSFLYSPSMHGYVPGK